MTTPKENPFAGLERLYHEPNRLGIMSMICAASEPLAFGELKTGLELTDGNLSRHLKALEEGGAIRVTKRFVGVRPRTTITVTAAGRREFLTYLDNLETVLQQASEALGKAPRPAAAAPRITRPAKA